jgi:predicted nucleotidyltransferase component of viral defense system
MITNEEIEAKAKELGLTPHEVEKDYIYGWLLNTIYSRSGLGSLLILKGGNCLRKAYLQNTRFSKDLDFSAWNAIDQNFLAHELSRVCIDVEEQTGVHFFTNKTAVKNKDPRISFDVLEARLYFKGFYGEENLSLKAQIDVTQSDSIYLPVQQRRLIHPYSDFDRCNSTIRAQKIEEVLASKLVAMLARSKAVDLFDLFISIFLKNEFAINRREIISTFLKKYGSGPPPSASKDQLLGLELDHFGPLWAELVVPRDQRFGFDYVVSSFKSLIGSLFDLIGTTVGGAIPPMAGHFPYPRGSAALGYLPTDVRNTLLAALRTETFVELIYKGWKRLVEPYKIEYRVRKSDNTGHEYFLGLRQNGGRERTRHKEIPVRRNSICADDESAIPSTHLEIGWRTLYLCSKSTGAVTSCTRKYLASA